MKIIAQYNNVMYVTDHSINDLIPKASAVYVINSGVGQEAMLHDKPVVSFGRSEYQGAVINAKLDDLNGAWDSVLNIDRKEMKRIYRNWYDWYLYEVVTHIK
jgi:capsule polysaccharide modification protein KpsS